MPYTLTMGLLWFAVAFVIGLVTGVVLRSVTARRQIARLRASIAAGGPPATRSPVPAPASTRAERPAVTRTSEPLEDLSAVPAASPDEVENTSHDDDVVAQAMSPGELPVVDPSADDLTRIVGLGPHVAELCRGIGISSWRELADTEVSLLRTMLDDAGGRYRIHDPSTWPAQARLLADGRWDDFDELAATLTLERAGVDPAGPAPSDER